MEEKAKRLVRALADFFAVLARFFFFFFFLPFFPNAELGPRLFLKEGNSVFS